MSPDLLPKRHDAAAAILVAKTVQSLKPDDYAFTVVVPQSGNPPQWDTYRFSVDGVDGTIAIRIVDGVPEVGLFSSGALTEAEVIAEIVRGSPN